MKIFTIGYEGVTQAELVATLQAAGVRLLVDVRAVPLSRRPGFSKNILAAGLREAGIDYVGLKALGTPAEGREAARKHQHARLADIYGRQLDLPEAIVQAEQLKDMAAQTPVALRARSVRMPPVAVARYDPARCRSGGPVSRLKNEAGGISMIWVKYNRIHLFLLSII